MKIKRITEETVKRIASKALEMPEKTSQREVSAREAVRLLKGEIQTLQERGYSIKEIAAFFGGEGLPIASLTLRAYMQRPTAAPARRKKAPADVSVAEPRA